MSKGRERSGKVQAPVIAVMVNGVQVTIDQRTLSMRERQRMKAALAGLEYEADDLDALTATIWVVMRRDDPTLTFEQASDAITMESLTEATSDEIDESSPEG